MRATLMGVQAAASIVLVILAALLTRGMVAATRVDIGFAADRMLAVRPAFPPGETGAPRHAPLSCGNGAARRDPGMYGGLAGDIPAGTAALPG